MNCPECGAGMIWTGSMASGGLACPNKSTHDAVKEWANVEQNELAVPDPAYDLNYTFLYKRDSGQACLIECDICGLNFFIAKEYLFDQVFCKCGNVGHVGVS